MVKLGVLYIGWFENSIAGTVNEVYKYLRIYMNEERINKLF